MASGNEFIQKNIMATENTIFSSTKEALKIQYLADSRPWVIAYSGGKDSTLVLQLVCEVLIDLQSQHSKPVYVITSDTLVEPPNVAAYISNNLQNITNSAKKQNLPIEIVVATPEPSERFWSKIIGKGYPSPTRWFRWCTTAMKIKPTKYIIDKITRTHGSVILLLGTREDESNSRKRRMEDRLYSERKLNPHHEIANALVFSPIQYWTNDDVWEYLYLNNPAPWGLRHDTMISLYKQANGGECPLVMDLNTPSCGGSRFGCWTCTVVKSDKSMEGFINTGDRWMTPLNNFRNWLKEIRENTEFRLPTRRDGSQGLGPFTPSVREEILSRLLKMEKELGLPLISDEEIAYIQSVWASEFDLGEKAIRLAKAHGRNIAGRVQMQLENNERQILDSLIAEFELSPEVVSSVLNLAEEFRLRHDEWGAKSQIQKRLSDIIETALKQAKLAGSV